MERFFDDERINAVKGRAMRKTVIFAWLFTLIYTVAVVVVDVFTQGKLVHAAIVDERFVLSGVLVQLITLIGGAVILLWGELGYIGSGKDEMKAYRKNLFYSKGFYAFVYIFAFAYCVHVSVNLFYDNYIALPNNDMPYGFFPSMLLECGGLFLIFSLKREKVMLNSAQIEGSGKRYFKKVFFNILKFGVPCAAFTAFAIILFIILSLDPMSLSCLGILLAGFVTWLSLSLEYFLLSLMERLSEMAQERGRLSLTTLITFILATVMTVYMALMSIYLNYFTEINSSAIVAMYSYISLMLERGILLMLAFFIMYFCSETEPMKEPTVNRSGRALVTVIISKLCFDVFFMVIKAIAGAKFLDFEGLRRCQMILLSADVSVDILYAVAVLICLIPCLRVLFEKKLFPRIPAAVTIAYTAFYILVRSLYGYFLRAPFNIIGICLPAALFIFFCVYVIKWFINVKFTTE